MVLSLCQQHYFGRLRLRFYSLLRGLTMEEKMNALNADAAQWTKAKNRVHFAVPIAEARNQDSPRNGRQSEDGDCAIIASDR